MNRKGFASSLIIYSLLILFLITLLLLFASLNNSTRINNNIKSNITESVNHDESTLSVEDRLTALETKVSNLEDKIYPVGSIYMSLTDETVEDVEERFGGTWEKMEDTFLLGASSNYKVGTTGGSSTHKHESPVNSLNSTYIGINNRFGSTTSTLGTFYSSSLSYSETGGTYTSYYTSEESNIPPYTAVYMYKRIE